MCPATRLKHMCWKDVVATPVPWCVLFNRSWATPLQWGRLTTCSDDWCGLRDLSHCLLVRPAARSPPRAPLPAPCAPRPRTLCPVICAPRLESAPCVRALPRTPIPRPAPCAPRPLRAQRPAPYVRAQFCAPRPAPPADENSTVEFYG